MESILSQTDHINWHGKRVSDRSINAGNIVESLPEFRRQPFQLNGTENPYLDLIVRLPFSGDDQLVPIATVSKQYALVQHRSITAQVLQAVTECGIDIDADEMISVRLSQFGELFWCSIPLVGFCRDPGDGEGLQLRADILNSVDGSCRLRIILGWLRFVCNNGLRIVARGYSFKAVHHLERLSTEEIASFLRRGTRTADRSMKEYQRWHSYQVTEKALTTWIDLDVRRDWGLHAAARVLSICRTGYDGRIGKAPKEKNAPVTAITVSQDVRVPGAYAPVKNVYHAYQALIWVAEHRNALQEVDRWSDDAVGLVRDLIKRHARRDVL